MILFAELQMMGDKHIIVNSGMLRIIQQGFPSDKIKVACDQKHYARITGKIGNTQNITHAISFEYETKEESKKYTLHKIWREIKLVRKVFKLAKKESAKFIFFASVFPFSGLTLNTMARLYKQRIIICQHGDLGVLSLKKDKLTTRIFRFSITSLLEWRSKYATLLLYGKTIADNLFAMFPAFKRDNLIVIDHPYEYTNILPPKILAKPIVIANIGTAIPIKNSQLLFSLAAGVEKEITAQKLKFVQIGILSEEVRQYANDLVEILIKGQEVIPAEKFEASLTGANYFVYFFGKGGYYDLCPSGTFFDAIKYKTPIIALKSDFFEHYFEQLGNIGYLCDTLEEMISLLRDIANGARNNEYTEQVNNLEKARQTLSIENIGREFIRQLTNQAIVSIE